MQAAILRAWRGTRRCAASSSSQLSGDDDTAVGFNAQGGVGCISVTANVAPKTVRAKCRPLCSGAIWRRRAQIEDKLAALHKVLFFEPSPAPAKYACSLLGLCTEDVRLPMIPCSDAAQGKVRAAMTHAGLL